MIHGKYINQGEELTDVLKVRQLSLCDAIENVRDEADELDVLAVNILVDLPVEKMKAAGTIAGTSTTDGLINGVGISTTDGLINGVGTNSIDDAGSLKTVSAGVDGKPVLYMGCGRILCDIEKFRFYIDQVGILPEFRNHGFGEFALRMLVDKANVCGAQKVWLKLPEKWVNEEAKERAVKFFTGMHFRFEAYDETPIAQAIQSVQDVQSAEAVRSAQTVRPAQAVGDDFANEGRWMVADIDDFHACCHH